MGDSAGGAGGSPELYLRGGGYPPSRGRRGLRLGLQNCFQTAEAGGGRVGARGKRLGLCLCVCDCVRTPGKVGVGKADSRRVAIEVSSLRLPLLPRDPLPPGAELGGGTRILTKLAITFPAGCSPRLDLDDRSFLLLFLFLERSAQ